MVDDVHPAAFLATIVCELPAANEPYVSVELNDPPSKLYVSPVTPVMAMEPVATVHVGWVGVAPGADGLAFTTMSVDAV